MKFGTLVCGVMLRTGVSSIKAAMTRRPSGHRSQNSLRACEPQRRCDREDQEGEQHQPGRVGVPQDRQDPERGQGSVNRPVTLEVHRRAERGHDDEGQHARQEPDDLAGPACHRQQDGEQEQRDPDIARGRGCGQAWSRPGAPATRARGVPSGRGMTRLARSGRSSPSASAGSCQRITRYGQPVRARTRRRRPGLASRSTAAGRRGRRATKPRTRATARKAVRSAKVSRKR